VEVFKLALVLSSMPGNMQDMSLTSVVPSLDGLWLASLKIFRCSETVG